jgi:hypothetical protein
MKIALVFHDGSIANEFFSLHRLVDRLAAATDQKLLMRTT